MEVTVELTCGRCGKIDAKSLTLEEAQALSDKEKEKALALENLPVKFNEAFNRNYPDVIIATRTPSGAYEVHTLDNLCTLPNAKRNKGCDARVRALLDDMFMRNPKPANKQTPKAKKKKGPENKEESE